MFHGSVPVLAHLQIAERTYRIRLLTREIAAAIEPGQFVMLRLPGTTDPLLGRPFALYDTVLDDNGIPIGIDVVYLIVGRMTGRLAEVREGESLEIWGPLGKPFPELGEPESVAFVAGGIGQTPFLAYTKHLLGTRGYGGQLPRKRTQSVTMFYGVRTASLAAGLEDFREAGVDVRIASDDGSLGAKGFVTQLLLAGGRAGPLVGCGPEPMLHALSKIASDWNVDCYVSLETPMACGIGICFSCATKVATADGWDYKRVCVDGPVFDAKELVWKNG